MGAPAPSALQPRSLARCLAHSRAPSYFLNDHMTSSLGTPKPGLSHPLQPVHKCPAAFPAHQPLGHIHRGPCLPSAPLTRRQASGTSPRSSSNASPGAGAAGGGRSPGSRHCPPRWLRKGLGQRGAQRDTGWAQGSLPAPASVPAFLFSCGRSVSRGFWALSVPDLGPLRSHEGPNVITPGGSGQGRGMQNS